MPQQYTLRLPYPPSVNTMWNTQHGHRVLSKKGRLYRQEAATLCLLAQLPRPLLLPVRIRVDMCAPDRRRRDLDNIFKAVGDALQDAAALANDADIDELHIVRGPVDRPYGHLVLTITAGV